MIMTTQSMLTTFDNPFDPFEQFTAWFLFDVEKGYNCCGKLMRIAKLSDDLSETEEDEEVERAIDKIIQHDFTNTYKKVTKELKTEELTTV